MESYNSDAFEHSIAENITKIGEENNIDLRAERPTASTKYSDVLCTYNGKSAWIECKMNHTDNLANPRFYYENGMWKTTYTTPLAAEMVNIINNSDDAKRFIEDISKFTGIDKNKIILATTKSMLKKENCVSLQQMTDFCDQRSDQYIFKSSNDNIGELVRLHYSHSDDPNLEVKASYIQAGDDFYKIDKANPLKFKSDIPIIEGTGICNLRVAIRDSKQFYEIHPELKLKRITKSSKYSFKPGTTKQLPVKI
jgi:hypothetical protein